MPGASLPSTDALASWSDNIDNWRAADADFLQKRSILRFSTAVSRNDALGPSNLLPAPAPGQVTYVANGGVDTNGGLEYIDATGSWRSVLSVKNLGVSDTSGSFGIRLSSDSTSSLSLETNQVVLGTNRILRVESNKLVFQTGLTAAELTTDGTGLVSNVHINAPSATLGNTTISALTISGTLTGGSVSISGNISASTLTISGTSNLGTSSTVGALIATGGVSAVTVYGSTSVRGGTVLLSGSKASNVSASNQFLDLGASETALAGDSLVLRPTSATSAVRFRSASGAPFALVVVSSTDPGLNNYPDGTIWVQP